MKKVSGTLKFVLLAVIGVAAAIIVLSCAQQNAQENADTGKLTVQQDSILIPVITTLSENDQRAMNAILTRYDKTLYRLQTYKDGKLEKTQGTLSDMFVEKAIASKAATEAKVAGRSQYMIKIGGLGAISHRSPTPAMEEVRGAGTISHASPTPAMDEVRGATAISHYTPTPAPENKKDSEELVKRLKPILEKYGSK